MEEKKRELPLSDAGQLALLGLFLFVWILAYLGLTVSTASLLSLALLAVIILFYNYLASYEEKLLEAKLGETYSTYKKQPGKWFAKIGRA